MRSTVLAAVLVASSAVADEGMWLFNDFPAATMKQAHGFAPDEAWLKRVRLGSLRLANGCSASFVSAEGLVMTNHHCIRSCLEDLSTPQRDLLTVPFHAKAREQEERCPKVEANQLIEITDVTSRVLEATKGVTGPEYQKALKGEQAKVEQECAKGDVKLRCDLVTLFNGATFHLYTYRRFQDVRMVFAPEFSMAAFGGDPDNFNFPRYGVDMAFLRVWEDGKPRPSPEALKFAKKGAKENDVVFTSGHPGGTERNRTVAQLEFQRDVGLPWSLMFFSELRGRLDEWMKVDPERTRVARSKLRSVENSLKALRGRQEALVAPGFLEKKRADEAGLRAKAPEKTAPAWDAVAKAMADLRPMYADVRLKEGSEATMGELFGFARLLVRNAEESKKPAGERLPEYTEARKPVLVQQLTGAAPISKDLEKAMLGWSLARMRNLLGADDPFVREVLGNKAPEDLAVELVNGTKVHDAAFRKDVLEGKVAIDADPLLVFAKKVDAGARAVRKKSEDQVEAVVKKNFELISEARRAVYGTQGYPDATFTLRLSYGVVKGYGAVKPMTTIGGFYARLTGKPPFAASEAWLAAKPKLKPETPFDVISTNDIIGGNSGSPLVDKNGDVVGLVFDGNLQSLGGNFGYDGRENRTTAVHGELILAALRSVYGGEALAKELTAR